MGQRASQPRQATEYTRIGEDTTQSTSRPSKLVMIRGERHDEIIFTQVIDQIDGSRSIPDSAAIVKRSNPYFGPKILLHCDGENYLLTAPGPESELLLWYPEFDEKGNRCGWGKLAEIKARLSDNLPSYDFCPECGDPLRTLKHEQQAEVGCCPNTKGSERS
jgi:hypothetical protein